MRARTSLMWMLLGTMSCAGQPPTKEAGLGATSAPIASASSAASNQPTAAAAANGAAAPGACGALSCRLFDDARAAFAVVLATGPRVLAIGEAHAPKGAESIPSSAKRFTFDLLPMLEGRASDLLVELMAPPQGCKAKTDQVRTKQRVVTEQQATTNQSDYVTMGTEARTKGIVPDLLRPTCADLDAIDRAGDDAIALSLTTIARLTKSKVVELIDRNAQRGVDKAIVTYGGAMHNDVAPPPERASWSFGPDLTAKTGGRYVELDLFVAEFIQDTDSWRRLAWYPHYDREKFGAKAVLFQPAPSSYVLILPKNER